ncbi:DUF4254 domain-containing protein [Nocardia stercoris]|uniref:DUF4254 domain-containing protein n=1 Tax=Nocardia stercoris TaxID=2483361 RepID=A0A3M2L898_9NOCA|nr:DUF4254 domain-containing protein [Nocardia stercoris]RMI32733.1 DUF4254 domain-containing protein [Nocardia stercoris]
MGDLPSATALLQAFREPTGVRLEHSVLGAARDLVECHERSYGTLGTGGAIDAERAALIDRIDTWVAHHVQHRGGASLHTETLGAVIDRMAAKWVTAQHALGLTGPADPSGTLPPAADAHLHWVRLAELADGYRDLVTDILEHRRRLPVF